ncbi:MAG TPA: SUMF1/EgtB/PvdO family nonheme iron enzyme [Thermoanaerobaculia bacterium]|jgi:formylglycine-generating enzyme required for sulfatase activity
MPESMTMPLRHPAFPDGITRDGLAAWYRAARDRTRELFALITPDAYYDRPIALRNPIVFYEGHLPAFSVNTLIKLALRRDGIDAAFETLFARGIDPESEDAAKSPSDVWPHRDVVQAYGAKADAMIEEALAQAPLDDVAAEACFTVIEHELMHQETLVYMLHALPYEKKIARATTIPNARAVANAPVAIPRGKATLGAPRGTFGWDNEFPQLTVDVDAFTIDTRNVTNGEYLEYVEATGAPAPHFWIRNEDEWQWRGMFAAMPLPLEAPVYVTHAEAEAYVQWRGARLMSEAEYHRAAFGTPSGEERSYPWGEELPDALRGNFDFASFDPVAAGNARGASAFGVHDLAGNGWEWTSSLFGGFPGFEAMRTYPQYSADFFDDAHYVLKGASPVTPRELVRRSFRNWFRPRYPFVFAKFRCAR